MPPPPKPRAAAGATGNSSTAPSAKKSNAPGQDAVAVASPPSKLAAAATPSDKPSGGSVATTRRRPLIQTSTDVAPTPRWVDAVLSNHSLLGEIAEFLSANLIVGLCQMRGLSKHICAEVDELFAHMDELAFSDIELNPLFDTSDGGKGSSEKDKLNLEAKAVELNGKISEQMVDFLLPRIDVGRIGILELEGWMSPKALDTLLPRFKQLTALFFEPGPSLYPPAELAALLRRSSDSLRTLVLSYSWAHWARVSKTGAASSTSAAPTIAAAGATSAPDASSASSSAGAGGAGAAEPSAADVAAVTSALGELALAEGGGTGMEDGAGGQGQGADASNAAAAAAASSGQSGARARRNARMARARAAAAAAASSSSSSSGDGGDREKSIFEETPEERAARYAATARAIKESAAAHGELAAAIRGCNAIRYLDLTLPMPWPDALPLADTLPPSAPLRVLQLFLRRPNLAPEVTAIVRRYGKGLRELGVTCQIPNEGEVSDPDLGEALQTCCGKRLRSLRLSGFALDMTPVLPLLPNLEELTGTSDGMRGCELALFVCPKLTKAHLLERRLVEPDPLGATIMTAADEAIARVTARAQSLVALPPADASTPVVLDLTPTPKASSSNSNAGTPAAPAAAGNDSHSSKSSIGAAAPSSPSPLSLPICSQLTELTLVFQQHHAAYAARVAAGRGPMHLRQAAAAARAAQEAIPGFSSRGSLRRAFLRALPFMSALEHLDLRRGHEYGPLLAAVADSGVARTLQSLTIQHVNDLAASDVIACVSAMPNLTELYLLHCGGLQQRAVLQGIQALLDKRLKPAASSAAAAAPSSGFRITVSRPAEDSASSSLSSPAPVGPAAGIRVCFGNALSQLDTDLAQVMLAADDDAAAAEQAGWRELALLERPTEM